MPRSLPTGRLRERRGRNAAQGITVDLEGRFRSAMTIGVDAEGKTVSNCVDADAAGVPR